MVYYDNILKNIEIELSALATLPKCKLSNGNVVFLFRKFKCPTEPKFEFAINGRGGENITVFSK